jgi:hypothetical protein
MSGRFRLIVRWGSWSHLSPSCIELEDNPFRLSILMIEIEDIGVRCVCGIDTVVVHRHGITCIDAAIM